MAENGSAWTPEVRSHVCDAIESVRREMTSLVQERTERANVESRERDRRYTERSAQQDKAVVDALAAAEKAVNAALVAADKAVEKEQLSAEKWRNNANEWRQAMDDRETRFMGKEEAAITIRAVEARVAKLEREDAQTTGRSEGRRETRQGFSSTMITFYFALSAGIALAALILTIVRGH